MFDRKKRAVGKGRREEERMLARRSFMWIMGRKVNRQIIRQGKEKKRAKGEGTVLKTDRPGVG